MVACSRLYSWQVIEMALGPRQYCSRVDATNRFKVNLYKANAFFFSKPALSLCASWMSTIPKILFHVNELSELWPNEHNQILLTVAFSCVTLHGSLPSKISEVTWLIHGDYLCSHLKKSISMQLVIYTNSIYDADSKESIYYWKPVTL